MTAGGNPAEMTFSGRMLAAPADLTGQNAARVRMQPAGRMIVGSGGGKALSERILHVPTPPIQLTPAGSGPALVYPDYPELFPSAEYRVSIPQTFSRLLKRAFLP